MEKQGYIKKNEYGEYDFYEILPNHPLIPKTTDNPEIRHYTIYVHYLRADPSKARYVGQTTIPVTERWRNGNGYKAQYFYEAIQEYGWDAFEHVILEVGDATPKEIGERETYWCSYYKAYDTYEGGYTHCTGRVAHTHVRQCHSN